MRITFKNRRGAARRGVAAVQLALVLPFLLTLVLTCVDFGRFAYTYIAVSNAAREGTAFAARTPWTSGTNDIWQLKLRAAVEAELGCGRDGSRFQASNVAIAISTQTTVGGSGKKAMTTPIAADPDQTNRVGVRVSYPFSTLVTWPGIPAHINLSRTVEMRVYR